MTLNRLFIVRCICACFALACLSGLVEAQTRMALVGPGVGWAVINQDVRPYNPDDHLFWTSDDGANWKDITPNDPASHQIAGLFFLDASRGWALLALKREPPKNNQEPEPFITDIRGFDLASTTDGGASWTIKSLAALPEGVGWTTAAQIFFLDAAHGWMNIASPVPHWGGEGVLLATADGGNTWKPIVEANGGGGYGPIRFTDEQNGWIAGGPGDQYLYATNDGGRHWREVVVPAPSAISRLFEDAAPLYASPRFRDSKQGFLPVMYSGSAKSGEGVNILALFSTSDGGHNWHLESWVNLDQATNLPIVAIIDSTAVAPRRVDHEPPTLAKLGPGGKLTETRAGESPELPSGAALLGLNFSDVAHGWASSSNGRLLSTGDGGATWKDVTPGRKKASTLAPSNGTSGGPTGMTLQNSIVASPASGPTAASSTITTYKSRHLGFDMCQAPPSSPQMSTWWTSSPYFDIGIYVGGSNRTCQQPNLISKWVTNVTGQGWGLIPLWVGPQAPCNSRSFSTYIDATGGAYAQGQAEADKATKGSKSAMANLGLGAGSVIYYDNPSPPGGNYHGYLYSGGTFTTIDFPGALATQVYSINNAGNMVGYYEDSTTGAVHGFLNQGGTYTSIDYPNATTTYALGINDDNQVAGYYVASGIYHGFLYQPGMPPILTPFDVNSSGTQAYGINGDAQIVGTSTDGLNFLYSALYPGGSFIYPPVSCALGVNNNEQITGCQGSNYVFLHEGNYVTILYPGASQMNAIYSPSDFILQNFQGTAKVAIVGSYYSNVSGFHGFMATSQ